MGVKDLWNILSPLSDRKPLFELQGKAIAIDLSCWVIDSQSVTDNLAQPKMYLRNLFFRTSYFLLHDIFPVFVLEGTAPELKHKTIAKRNDVRYGGQEKKTTKKGGRSRFNHVLYECEEMLRLMGLTCVKGHGEAEAMCAYLNDAGLVHGCISQDSDCFLYGAKIVYRNFCTSSQGNRTTSGGSIDEYSMEKIQQIFNLGRNKMIALALLCGCDYNEGLTGVGKEAALKLFKIVEDDEILKRMKEWRTDFKFKEMEMEISNPNLCTNCGHPGKMRSHTRVGCVHCGTNVKCSDSYKEKRNLISNELAIRRKALMVENFPNQEIIDEFLIRKGPIPSELDLKWKKPKIINFVAFMEKKLLWEPAYAFAKIFPLMTRWQLINLIEYPIEERLSVPDVFVPEKIKKIRNIRSIASYEILWVDKDNILEGLTLIVPGSDKENNEEETPDTLTELVTIEPQNIVLHCYPNIVDDFESLRNAKKKPVRTRKKKINNIDEESMEKKKSERKKRGKSKNNEIIKNRKITEFVSADQREPTLEESFGKLSITPKRRKKDNKVNIPSVKKRGPQFDKVMTTERLDSILNGSLEAMFNQLTPEDFMSDVDNSIDMTIIINDICNKKSTSENMLLEHEQYISSNIKQNNIMIERSLEHQKGILKNHSHNNKVKEITKLRDNINEVSHSKNDIIEGEFDKTVDEFDIFDKPYVPLEMRINVERGLSAQEARKSLTLGCNKENISIGIDSLLNESDN